MYMSRLEDKIRKIDPYVPGEQPDYEDMIKLNTNENPYPPSPMVQKMMEMDGTDKLRLYPKTDARELTEALSGFYHLPMDQIFVGVGSDDVLAMCFLTFFNSKEPVLFPDITYSFYDVWANLYRIPYECQPLDKNMHIIKEDYYKKNGGIVIANPNAPTSIAMHSSDIEDIIAHNQDVVVIIDEAYVDFGGESVVKLIDKYDNLVVVQTFSKARSMAGMRIGYAMASKKLIKALSDVKNSYNSYTMNRPSIMLGAQAVKDTDYFYQTLNKIIKTREWTKNELRAIGFECPDSKTNFLFITHPNCTAAALFEYLKTKHIYVRYFGKPRISEYLRVSIGTDAQMEFFVHNVKEFLQLNHAI